MIALLHVDDEDAMAFLFRAAVREGNIQATVDRVADGVQALAFLRRLGPHTSAMRPDLVFLDINMPRVDGWQVLLEMRDDENLRCIPVVVLSTISHVADKSRIYALGAKHYILKPGIFSVLVAEVISACQKFAA